MTPLVVLVADQFFPDEGGAEHQMRRVLGALADRGWRVLVLTRARGGGRGDAAAAIPISRLGDGRTGPMASMRFVMAAVRRLAKERPSVVIGLQLGGAGLAAAAGSALIRCPAVLRLTGGSEAGSELEVRSGKRFERITRRPALRQASAVVSPANHLLAKAGAFTGQVAGKGRVIANGVDRRLVPAVAGSRDIVVWLGRPNAVKGLGDLAQLAALTPELSYVAAGISPHDLPEAPANLACVGMVADPWALLARAKLLVSTSRFEGTSNAVLEALAAGVRVAGYSIDGNREVADMVGSGLRLVPIGDVCGLAAAVRELLADSDPAPVGAVTMLEDAVDEWELLLEELLPEVSTR